MKSYLYYNLVYLHLVSFLFGKKIVCYDLYYSNFQIFMLDLSTVLSNSKSNILVHS